MEKREERNSITSRTIEILRDKVTAKRVLKRKKISMTQGNNFYVQCSVSKVNKVAIIEHFAGIFRMTS